MPVQILGFREYVSSDAAIRTSEQLEALIRQVDDASIFAVDYETSGTAWYQHASICGIALGVIETTGQIHTGYIPLRHYGETQLSYEAVAPSIKRLLADPTKTKVAHNIKFEDHMSRREGWSIVGPRYDTMVAARCYDENRLVGLKERAETDLGWTHLDQWEDAVDREVTRLAKGQALGKRVYKERYGYSQVPVGVLAPYACLDVEATLSLFLLYENRVQLSVQCPRVWQTEMELTRVICDMEQAGLRVDVEYLAGLKERLGDEIYDLENALNDILGRSMNYGSDAEVGEFVYKDLGITPWKFTKRMVPSVDHEVLEQIKEVHAAIPLLLQWRLATKLQTTYTTSITSRLDRDGFVHGDFRADGTSTGRLSSRNPNLQNIASDSKARKDANGGVDPWSIRRAFVVRDRGWVRICCDYSQIELRVLAYYCADPVMRDVYLTGGDIHERTSVEVFGSAEKELRRKAKMINFGLSYGLTERGFARQAGITEEEATKHFARFFERYHGIPRFRTMFWEHCRLQGDQFQNLFGRPRRIPGLSSPSPKDRGRAERQAIGSLIQGTAAELTKESLVRIANFLAERGIPGYLVSTIHDEIQIDVPIEAFTETVLGVKARMEAFAEFDPIPIVVDVEYTTTNWAEKRGV